MQRGRYDVPAETRSDWDPKDQTILGNQRHAYDAMRESCPVAHSDFLGWSLFRHSDIDHVISNPGTYSNASKRRAVPNGMDPPEHTRYRRAIDPFFAPDQVAAFKTDIWRLAVTLMEAIDTRKPFDFVTEFSGPYCSKSLCTFLGWPEDTWIPILEWTHGNQEAALSRDPEIGAALARRFTDIVLGQIQTRRQDVQGVEPDLTTTLMSLEVEGHRLTDDELVSALRNWTAGHGTVAAALEIVLFHVASNVELQSQLRSDPELIPAAVNEILRMDGPLVANGRTATIDVEINGRKIGAGERLTLMWIAANRDPDAFEDPKALKLDRDQGKSLLYGAGIHNCVGAPLARLELNVAIEVILSLTSVIELPEATTPKRALYPGNGFLTLEVRFR
jgi:cytochrome P450